uniref:TLDc domain-containing protein n=1 Tax=Lates calcarifer TaxID=8187 RepID=A0A4W6CLF8_LATCA
MNPMLSSHQQRTICSQLGIVRLELLYKATIHGFTGAAFHERCDTHSPTLSVGYNDSGYVFGGYTRKPFSKSGQYMYDDQAFLFTFSGEMLLKYPVTNSSYALYMDPDSGPDFGGALTLVKDSQAKVSGKSGNRYSYNAADVHGNNLNLTECEVYQLKVAPEFEKPWRPVIWESEKRTEMMDSIKLYSPMVNSVSQVRVLLIGPVGAGKSSFFNSINSVFRGHVTNQASTGCSASSLTTQVSSYEGYNNQFTDMQYTCMYVIYRYIQLLAALSDCKQLSCWSDMLFKKAEWVKYINYICTFICVMKNSHHL